jgi:hypothetical protein
MIPSKETKLCLKTFRQEIFCEEKNKTREYALKYRKKLIEIIIFVKKNFSG